MNTHAHTHNSRKLLLVSLLPRPLPMPPLPLPLAPTLSPWAWSPRRPSVARATEAWCAATHTEHVKPESVLTDLAFDHPDLA